MAINLKKLNLNPREEVLGFHLIQFQENVNNAVLGFNNTEFQNGTFLDCSLTTSDTVINHGLDRKIQGWIVVNKNANANIWQSTTTNTFPNKQIILKSSAAVTATIYFF